MIDESKKEFEKPKALDDLDPESPGFEIMEQIEKTLGIIKGLLDVNKKLEDENRALKAVLSKYRERDNVRAAFDDGCG